jgi:hypothetical protein
MAKIKKILTTPNVSKDTEQQKLSYIINANLKWYNSSQNCLAVSYARQIFIM